MVVSEAAILISPAASSVEPLRISAVTVFMTTLAEKDPPRANFSPPAPPRVTLTRRVSAPALTSMVDAASMAEFSTRAVTLLKIRFTPTAAPTPAWPVEMAIPPAAATLVERSSAVKVTALAEIALSTTLAVISLSKILMATEPAMASFVEPAPATATVTTVPVSLAVAEKSPEVSSVEPSTRAVTLLSRELTAMAAPRPAVLPAARAPAKE